MTNTDAPKTPYTVAVNSFNEGYNHLKLMNGQNIGVRDAIEVAKAEAQLATAMALLSIADAITHHGELTAVAIRRANER